MNTTKTFLLALALQTPHALYGQTTATPDSISLIPATNSAVSGTDIVQAAQPPSNPRPILEPEVKIVGNTVLAQGSEYSVAFAADLKTPGAVALRQRNLSELRSSVVGLVFYEISTGRSVLIAQVKSTPAYVLGKHQVAYANAFKGDSGIRADVVYTCTLREFQQDVVLRTRLPDPAKYGFAAADTEFAVLTEFYESPEPVLRAQDLDLSEWNKALGTKVPPLADEIIGFGTMRMIPGKAFSLQAIEESIPVRKSWRVLNGRKWLIESTPYQLITPLETGLPKPTASLERQIPHYANGHAVPDPIKAGTSNVSILVAQNDLLSGSGVVIDYILSSSPLLNVFFSGAGSTNTGIAAVGQDTNDFWNLSNTHMNPGTVTFSNLYWSDGSSSTLDLTVANAPGGWATGATGYEMYRVFVYSWNGQSINVTMSQIPGDVYDLYVYGHGNGQGRNGLYRLKKNGNEIGYKRTSIWGSEWLTINWIEGVQYVVFRNVSVTNGDTLAIEVVPAADWIPSISGFQLVPSGAVETPTTEFQKLINIDFCNLGTTKVGFAALGASTNDYWNLYHQTGTMNGALTNLSYADSTSSGVNLGLQNAPGYASLPTPPGPIDNMYDGYMYPSNGGNIAVTLNNLSNGLYSLYTYARAESSINSQVSLSCGGTNYGPRGTTRWGQGWATANWEEGQQFIAYRDVLVVDGNPVAVTVSPDSAKAVIHGMQIAQQPEDSDSDGMPDWWEMKYFGTLSQSGSDDYDGDGVSNLAEFLLGRNPKAGAGADTNSVTRLTTYTPLR